MSTEAEHDWAAPHGYASGVAYCPPSCPYSGLDRRSIPDRMSAEQTPDIERVLARCRCHDVHGDMYTPPYCESCRSWAAYVAQALAPVLAAAVREAEQRAWDEDTLTAALMDAVFVPGPICINKDGALVLTHDEARSAARRLLRGRADRVAEPQHEAATSGKESEASDE